MRVSAPRQERLVILSLPRRDRRAFVIVGHFPRSDRDMGRRYGMLFVPPMMILRALAHGFLYTEPSRDSIFASLAMPRRNCFCRLAYAVVRSLLHARNASPTPTSYDAWFVSDDRQSVTFPMRAFSFCGEFWLAIFIGFLSRLKAARRCFSAEVRRCDGNISPPAK